MFSSQKNSPQKPVKKQTPIKDSAVTILTSGCHFNGKLFCQGSTRIGGKIEGEIASEGLLIIEDEANINADIKADEVVVQGVVKGKLEATSRVELCSSGSFEGDIISPILVINEGANFNGRAAMNKGEDVPISEETTKEITGGISPKKLNGKFKNKKEPEIDVSRLKVPDVGMGG